LFLNAVLLFGFGLPAQAQQKPAGTEIERRAGALLGKLTLEEKITLLGGVRDFYTRPIPRVGIPTFRMSDGRTGVLDCGPATAYPAGVLQAASWDKSLPRRVGVSMGQDARARGVHFILALGVNYRAPPNGQNFEYLAKTRSLPRSSPWA
jgi:beta-glucosidase